MGGLVPLELKQHLGVTLAHRIKAYNSFPMRDHRPVVPKTGRQVEEAGLTSREDPRNAEAVRCGGTFSRSIQPSTRLVRGPPARQNEFSKSSSDCSESVGILRISWSRSSMMERTRIAERHACVTDRVVIHIFSYPGYVTASELEHPASQWG